MRSPRASRHPRRGAGFLRRPGNPTRCRVRHRDTARGYCARARRYRAAPAPKPATARARLRRRTLQSISAVLGAHERELRAVEREPFDAELAPSRQPPHGIERTETDERAARRQERRRVAGGARANVAECELGAAPAPRGVEPRVIERQPELRRHPRADLVLIVRQLAKEQLDPPSASNTSTTHVASVTSVNRSNLRRYP